MQRFSGLELKSLSINTLTQFIVRMLGSIATLSATLLIAYFLGLDSVGSFTKVTGFVSLFYLFLDFGLNSMLLKNDFSKVKANLGNLVVLRLLLSFILIPTVIVLATFLPHNSLAGTGFSDTEKYAIALFSLVLIGIGLINSLQAFLQKELIYKKAVIPGFMSSVVVVLIVLLGIYLHNFYLLFAAYVVAGLLQTTLLYLSLKRRFGLSLKTNRFFSFSKELLISSWPLGIMLVFNLLYAKAEVLLLAIFKPNSDVGVYGISYRFFEVAIALPAFLANSTYPLLLKRMDDKKSYNILFKKYLWLYFILSIFVTAVVFAGAPLIGILRNGFHLSILPLQILSLYHFSF